MKKIIKSNKIVTVRPTGPLTCVWVRTDNPRAPLTALWMEFADSPELSDAFPSEPLEERQCA